MTDSQARRDRRGCVVYGGIFGLAVAAGWGITSPWSTSMVRVVTCGLGVLLVLLVQFLRGSPIRQRLLTGALVAWCGASLGWTVARPLAELPSGDSVRVWSVFHYYLGIKYFPELGYTELYGQALAADAEGPGNWFYVRRVRNLETYEVEDIGRPRRSALWSDARWEEFKRDLVILEPYVSKRSWRNIFRDHGYNAPPSFTALRRPFLNDLSPASLSVTASFDVIALIAAFIAVARVFGVFRALVCATWVALYFGNVNDRLIGHPFLYDYLVALLFAACALKKDRPVLGGILLAYAAMMRVFPGFMVVAGVAWWCALYWRRRQTSYRLAWRLATAFTATCAVLAVVGLANGRGLDGWRDFLSNITQHSEHHRVGERRVGLAHLFTIDWSDPLPADQGKSQRYETWDAQEGAWLVVAGGLGVLWLWAMARSRFGMFDMIFGSLILVFCGLVLSRYYWSSACLFMLMGGRPRDGPMAGRGPALMAAALFAWSTAVYGFSIFDDEDIHQYLLANFLATVLVVGVLSLLILRQDRVDRTGLVS